MTPQLLELPSNIVVQLISTYLSLKDWIALQATCKRLEQIINRMLRETRSLKSYKVSSDCLLPWLEQELARHVLCGPKLRCAAVPWKPGSRQSQYHSMGLRQESLEHLLNLCSSIRCLPPIIVQQSSDFLNVAELLKNKQLHCATYHIVFPSDEGEEPNWSTWLHAKATSCVRPMIEYLRVAISMPSTKLSSCLSLFLSQMVREFDPSHLRRLSISITVEAVPSNHTHLYETLQLRLSGFETLWRLESLEIYVHNLNGFAPSFRAEELPLSLSTILFQPNARILVKETIRDDFPLFAMPSLKQVNIRNGKLLFQPSSLRNLNPRELLVMFQRLRNCNVRCITLSDVPLDLMSGEDIEQHIRCISANLECLCLIRCGITTSLASHLCQINRSTLGYVTLTSCLQINDSIFDAIMLIPNLVALLVTDTGISAGGLARYLEYRRDAIASNQPLAHINICAEHISLADFTTLYTGEMKKIEDDCAVISLRLLRIATDDADAEERHCINGHRG